MEENLKLIMLVGIPGSGKSTWIKKFLDGYGIADNATGDWVILSSDNFIENHAKTLGKTYDQVFSDVIDTAQMQLFQDLDNAIASKKNVIWDQTNLTVKSRIKKMNMLPMNYTKHAVFFEIPSDLDARLASRPGKTLRKDLIDRMKIQMEEPTTEEGFDSVSCVKGS